MGKFSLIFLPNLAFLDRDREETVVIAGRKKHRFLRPSLLNLFVPFVAQNVPKDE